MHTPQARLQQSTPDRHRFRFGESLCAVPTAIRALALAVTASPRWFTCLYVGRFSISPLVGLNKSVAHALFANRAT